jgi:hypothetical protein
MQRLLQALSLKPEPIEMSQLHQSEVVVAALCIRGIRARTTEGSTTR